MIFLTAGFMHSLLPAMSADLNISITRPGKTISGTDQILNEVSSMISSGLTVAIKGIGGYFLMCDALNNDAVVRLRQRKQREAKPLAVMFRDISELKKYCYADKSEERELKSWRRPILILKQKKALAAAVSNGLEYNRSNAAVYALPLSAVQNSEYSLQWYLQAVIFPMNP